MSERPTMNVQEAFDPELRQAQADLNAYTETRPYQDVNGKVHDPQTNAFVNADTYFEGKRNESEQASLTVDKEGKALSYEDMTMPQLARKLAQAEHSNDKTSAGNISDVLLEKMEDFASKNDRDRDGVDADTRRDNLFDRIMGVKDKETARLEKKTTPSKKNATKETSDESNDNVEKTEATSAEAADESKSTVDANEKSTEDFENDFKSQVFVEYAPENGRKQLGLEFTETDTNLKWNKHKYTDGPSRKIILTAENGKKIYIRGYDMYDLDASEASGQHVGWDAEELPDAKIGEQWSATADWVDSPIQKAEIQYKTANEASKLENYEQRGEDPFAAADKLLASLDSELFENSRNNDPSEQPTAKFEPIDPREAKNDEPGTDMVVYKTRARRFKDRMRNAMSPTAWYLGAVNRANRADGKERSKKRTAVAAVLGIAAVGGTYLAAKHFGVDHHGHGTGSATEHAHHTANSHHHATGAHHHAAEHASHHTGSSHHGSEAAKTKLHSKGGSGNSVHELKKSLEVKSGKNPWTVSEEHLKHAGNHNPTNAQIEAYDKRLAQANPDIFNYDDDSAEHIDAGTKLVIPR